MRRARKGPTSGTAKQMAVLVNIVGHQIQIGSNGFADDVKNRNQADLTALASDPKGAGWLACQVTQAQIQCLGYA